MRPRTVQDMFDAYELREEAKVQQLEIEKNESNKKFVERMRMNSTGFIHILSPKDEMSYFKWDVNRNEGNARFVNQNINHNYWKMIEMHKVKEEKMFFRHAQRLAFFDKIHNNPLDWHVTQLKRQSLLKSQELERQYLSHQKEVDNNSYWESKMLGYENLKDRMENELFQLAMSDDPTLREKFEAHNNLKQCCTGDFDELQNMQEARYRKKHESLAEEKKDNENTQEKNRIRRSEQDAIYWIKGQDDFEVRTAYEKYFNDEIEELFLMREVDTSIISTNFSCKRKRNSDDYSTLSDTECDHVVVGETVNLLDQMVNKRQRIQEEEVIALQVLETFHIEAKSRQIQSEVENAPFQSLEENQEEHTFNALSSMECNTEDCEDDVACILTSLKDYI